MDYASTYAEFLKKHIQINRVLRVVCDASNGTTSLVLQKLINIPNLEIILINSEMNPEFPAHGPNPLADNATNDVSKKVIETKADFGVVFDADGDRAFFVDNEGSLLPSFVTSAVLFSKANPPFVSDELVYMSLTTSGLYKEQDIFPSRVGSIFIKEAVHNHDASTGAEYSGHFYFKDFFGLDSGIFSFITIANTLSQQDKTLAEIHKSLNVQCVEMTNVKLAKISWDKVKEIIKSSTASYAKNYFEREGLTYTIENKWVNVRSSNTEPLVRITVGAPTKEECLKIIVEVSNLITENDK